MRHTIDYELTDKLHKIQWICNYPTEAVSLLKWAKTEWFEDRKDSLYHLPHKVTYNGESNVTSRDVMILF